MAGSSSVIQHPRASVIALPERVARRCGSPLSSPRLNQVTRCSDEPCVNFSGITRPVASFCRRSSPIAAAAWSAFLDVAGIELDFALGGTAGLGGGVAPHAGVAVGLQLEAHRQLVGAARIRLLLLAHLRFGAGQPLHVMAELVGEDVRLREVAGRAEAPLQLVEEAEIEVDLASPGQ